MIVSETPERRSRRQAIEERRSKKIAEKGLIIPSAGLGARRQEFEKRRWEEIESRQAKAKAYGEHLEELREQATATAMKRQEQVKTYLKYGGYVMGALILILLFKR